MMSRVRYPLLFVMSVIVLTAATLISYGRIGGTLNRSVKAGRWPGDSAPEHPPLVIPTRADYDRFAAPDSAWRAQNARQYTVAELRARGDGTRSDREILDDRVYTLSRRGDTKGAVSVLERWVTRHPRDKGALLSLARLLREDGRTDAAVARYRQLLSLGDE
jgi:tetratricopeptide (TPR) repeat protein